MLHPSYSDLMAVANMATSKRARQIIAGDQPLLDKDAEGMKPLSIAVEELAESKIRILGDDEEE